MEMAEELLRFAEDQFVVWDVPDRGRATSQPAGEAATAYWITPTVLEQYNYYVPVCRSMAMMIVAYQKAHEVTGEAIYLAKAKALANSLTVGQAYYLAEAEGQFPTIFTRFKPTGNPSPWINNTVYPAKCLLGLDAYLARAGAPLGAAPEAP